MPNPKHALALALALWSASAAAQTVLSADHRAVAADHLATVLQTEHVITGFATTPAGRTFLAFSRIDGSAGPQVVEWRKGGTAPYPDASWNSPIDRSTPARSFVNVNALRTGADGALWVVDIGASGLDGPKLANGPKLVRIDLATDKVSRVYPLDGLTKADSRLDDVRFHGPLAYITDAGSPGVIVLDLVTGIGRRVLDGDPSLTARRPFTAEDHVLRRDGTPVTIHDDQLEVSPDGKFIYYQPANGPMSRVATRYIDDAKLTTQQLVKHISTFAQPEPIGGTAMGADGTIFCSDTKARQIIAIDPDGHSRVLIADPRLVWVNAMWLDDAGFLYLPATQLNRMAPFNGGVSKLDRPITVYRINVGVKPPASDHP